MPWSTSEGDRVAEYVLRMRDRAAIDAVLERVWSLRCAHEGERATYVGPQVGGWLHVRYEGDCAVGAAFTRVAPVGAPDRRQGDA